MRANTEAARVLALDARHRICGYAAFDDGRLLDWGCLRSSPPTGLIRGLNRVGRIVRPDIVVLRRMRSPTSRRRSTGRAVARIASRFARRKGWAVEYVSDAALQRFFRRSGYKTNEQIAAALAASFPELKPKLPSHRKVWEPQDWRMPIFDATGLAVAFMAARSVGEKKGRTLPPAPTR